MNNGIRIKQPVLTKEGLNNLKKELKLLEEKRKPQLVKRVTIAREHGDLSENSEYTSAREALSFTEGRIEQLQSILGRAKVISANNKKATRVRPGCKVTVCVNKEKHIFTLVGEWEADPMNKKISNNSPLGKALIGRKVGDKVEVEAPAGKMTYQIKRIS